MYWCVLVLAPALALALALLLLLFAVVAIVIVCAFLVCNKLMSIVAPTIQLYPPNFQRLALLRCCDVVNSSAMMAKCQSASLAQFAMWQNPNTSNYKEKRSELRSVTK